MNYDFHSHFLPGIDDGAKNPAQSTAILKYLKQHGIKKVCATPHYSAHHESVEDFLERREESINSLWNYIRSEKIDPDEFPEIIYGAEVRLSMDLSENTSLSKLCYTGTNAILLELPFQEGEEWEIEEVYNITYQHKVTPIMAHINRYTKLLKPGDFKEIFLNGNVIPQINCESALSFSLFHKTKKLINDYDVVFGCDMHDPAKFREYGLEKMQKYLTTVYEKKANELSELENKLLPDK